MSLDRLRSFPTAHKENAFLKIISKQVTILKAFLFIQDHGK
jgi:hypothetical protein